MDVSVFKVARDTTPHLTMGIGKIHGYLTRNKGLIKATQQVRQRPDKRARNAQKLKLLPVFTIHGVLPSRKKDRAVRVSEWSGLVQVDIDALPDGETTEGLRDRLFEDPCVALAFVSPGGEGVKLAVAVEGIEDPATYRAAFHAAQMHFRRTYSLELDATCKDDSRCCYMCHDAGAQYRMPLELEPLENLDPIASAAEVAISENLARLDDNYIKDHKQNIAAYKSVVSADKGAVEGEGGDQHTLVMAMKGRDFGLTPQTVFSILSKDWNARCEPPWDLHELKAKVDNAFTYAERPAGELSIPDNFEVVEAEAEEWQALLRRDRKGVIESSIHNLALIVGHDKMICPPLAWDDFKGRPVFTQAPHWRHAEPGDGFDFDSDLAHVAFTLSSEHGIEAAKGDIVTAIVVISQRKRFHPLRESLSVLKWDGTPRALRLFTDYIQCDGDPRYVEACARVMLVSAVARAFSPGCKADQMVILEGAQGVFKSTAVRVLFNPWAQEAGAYDLGSKDFVQAAQGAWVIEIPELDSLSRGDVNTVKGMLSKQFDVARMPYGRDTREYPRQCIFVGTTNEQTYLRDNSGNRRYLPLLVKRILIDKLKEDRDQILAEAVALYRGGTKWYLEGEIDQIARAEADSRRVTHPWEVQLEPVLTEWDEPTVGWHDLKTYLGIKSTPRPSDSATLTGVMKTLGWELVGALRWRKP